jgi:ABC-type Zn2+ transport system substrate-binding protein/surface adhesin
MKQTAVEWLVEELEKHHTKIDIKNTVAFNQAKAMEKEQIKEAFKHGELPPLFVNFDAEQYYNETYGK